MNANRKNIIEELESVFDNVAHELFDTEYFSDNVASQLLDKYYEFRKDIQELIKSDFPSDEKFGNF
jgi:hypothetical protein